MECQDHGGKITLVCLTCDNKLLCPQCFDDHTKGHAIQSLRKVTSRIQQELNDLSANYSQHLSDIRLDIRDTQTQQKEQDVLERQACDQINAQRQMLHKAIDESADNHIKLCKQRKQNNLSALQEREKALLSQNAKITNNQSKITKMLQSENFEEFINTSEKVNSMKVENIPPTPLETFDFHTSQINKEIIDSMFGQIASTKVDDDVSDFIGSLRSRSSLSISQNAGSDFVDFVRSEGGLTIVSTINNNTSDWVIVIHPSVPGYAWVKWYGQNKFQLIDRHGHVTQSVNFNKQTTGITTTPDNRLLVCGVEEKCIYQVVYGSKPSIFFDTTLYPLDVCTTYSGDVLVSMVDSTDFKTRYNSRRTVSWYSSRGHHLSDGAEYDRFGDRLFVKPYRIAVNNISTAVAVVNKISERPHSSHLVLLDKSLNPKLRYDGKVTPSNKKYKPNSDINFCLQDVTFTPECNILVAESYSKTILLLNSDCQLLNNLWSDELRPTALCLQNDRELWCAYHKKDGGIIKVIKQSTCKELEMIDNKERTIEHSGTWTCLLCGTINRFSELTYSSTAV